VLIKSKGVIVAIVFATLLLILIRWGILVVENGVQGLAMVNSQQERRMMGVTGGTIIFLGA